jgi:hypothetical protein
MLKITLLLGDPTGALDEPWYKRVRLSIASPCSITMTQPVRSYGCSAVWITPNMRGSLNINVQKEFNKGHQRAKTPKNERLDHVHDYKPKPNKHQTIRILRKGSPAEHQREMS